MCEERTLDVHVLAGSEMGCCDSSPRRKEGIWCHPKFGQLPLVGHVDGCKVPKMPTDKTSIILRTY